MTNSLLLGEFLYKELSSDEALKKYVCNKIFPILVKDEDVKFPFIVFFRNGIQSNLNKDKFYLDRVSYSVVVVSNKYDESIYIANEVRRILEFKKKTSEGMVIYDSKLSGTDEGFVADCYVQTLVFECFIQ